jgi:hypothetical protein
MKPSIFCGIALVMGAGCSYNFKFFESTDLEPQHTDSDGDTARTTQDSDTNMSTDSTTTVDTGSNTNSDTGTTSDTGSELPCVDDSIESPCWFDAAWEHRSKINILAAQVSGTNQQYFPVLISSTYAEWKGPSHSGQIGRTNGGDIVFTSNDAQTQLKHEIEQYDPSSGRLVAWVQVPVLSSSTNTIVYMYYGNPAAQDQWDVSGVWDDGGNHHFKGVWHMSQAGLENRLDSTINGNHCIPEDYTGNENEPGVAGNADRLDGVNDLLNCGIGSSLNIRNQITISAWINPSPPRLRKDRWNDALFKSAYCFFLYGTTDTRTTIGAWFAINGVEQDIWDEGTIDIPPDTWSYIVTTYDGNQIKVYVNAQLDFAVSLPGTMDDSTASPLTIGQRPDGLLAGAIDELRISQIARSADWVITSYNNQSSPSTFYTVAAPISQD